MTTVRVTPYSQANLETNRYSHAMRNELVEELIIPPEKKVLQDGRFPYERTESGQLHHTGAQWSWTAYGSASAKADLVGR